MTPAGRAGASPLPAVAPRAVIVTVVAGVIELRAKGLRSTETLDVAWCYTAAVRQRLQLQRVERAKGRRRK